MHRLYLKKNNWTFFFKIIDNEIERYEKEDEEGQDREAISYLEDNNPPFPF